MPALPQPPMVHHHPQSRYNTARAMAATRQPYFAPPVVQHLQPAPTHVHAHVHGHAHGHGAHGKHQQASADRSNAPVCYHWQRGFCERGTACKFAHPLGELTENQQTVTPKRKDTCRHWQRGHCALGKACKFAHPTKPCSFFPNCSKSDTECQFRHIRNPAERERVRRGQHGQQGHTDTTGDASPPSSPKRSQQQPAVSPPTTRRINSFGRTNAAQSPSRYFPSSMGVPQLPADPADYFMAAAGSDTFSASSPTGQPMMPFAAAAAAVADHPLFSHQMRGEYGQQGTMYYDDSIWQADPPTKHPATSSAASSASEPWNTDDASESPSTPMHEAQVPDTVVACSPFDDKQFDLSILSLLDD